MFDESKNWDYNVVVFQIWGAKGENVTDTGRLNALIKERGYKKEWIAAQMGISRHAFRKKTYNENVFTAQEIKQLCRILRITSLREKEAIFFADESPKTGRVKM